ncbi:Ig domain protein, group 2 domain protein [Desulfitobacterium hafniense]|uniref:Ig domain protein, group 2 domain protein n=1 Tax=Desulfitobacterium hafniense TaxID=49338 RepID=A0A098B381_DESHA|nr:Ig-like domain-containing protein [Desulfitobacterium hafniense]CDX03323.1 Ig domain protein, group 2 domain protein [Desulfitobacterium hafniense]
MVKLLDPDTSAFRYMLDSVGQQLTINGDNQIIAILSSIPVNGNNHDDKYISTKDPIKQGDMVDFNLSKWLIISQINGQRIVKFKGLMRKCNYNIKFNFQGNVKPFPAIVETKVLDVDSGKYMTLPTGKIVVSLQNNVDTRDIVLAQRFLIMGQPWKVSGIDKSQNGLIVLNCDYDSFSIDDDLVNEIADRWKYEVVHNYVLTIDNGDTSSVNINDVISINASVTDNGAIMTNPDITYLSDDSNIASVDNTGKVMGIGLGTANITAQMTNNPNVKDIIAITVQEAPVGHNFSITINGATSIKVGQTSSFTATFYDNGIEVTDQSGVWTVLDTDGTSTGYASITAQTGNSVSVKAGSTSNVYVNLWCTLDSDNSITASKNIKIASLW